MTTKQKEIKMKVTLPLSLNCGCCLSEYEAGLSWQFNRCRLHSEAALLLKNLKAMTAAFTAGNAAQHTVRLSALKTIANSEAI